MANDFSGDSNCVALYRFENGALTTDSKGTNTLQDVNTVTANTAAYKEGSASADFDDANGEGFYVTDANLSAGFPLKSGDTNKKISLAFWILVDSYDGSHGQAIVSKYDSGNNKRSLLLFFDNANSQKLTFVLGYNSGASGETVFAYGTALTVDRWYHIGFTYDDSSKAYRLRIWDDTAGDFLGADATGNATNNINAEDALFGIACRDNYGSPSYLYFDGQLDELAVFNDILTTDEIDDIRAGTYGAGGGTSLPLKHPFYRPFCGPLGRF